MSGLKTSVHYTLSFKLKVIDEVLNGGLSKEAANKKYGIKGNSTITKWIRKLGPSVITIEDHILTDKEYKNRIKELEQMLEHEKMKRKAAELMIEIAEKTMNIEIKKKSDTRQSKK